MTESSTNKRDGGKVSPAQSWARALELTAPIARHPDRIFPKIIEEHAARFGEAPALLSERECLTYRGLAERANQYSRWALSQDVRKGDCVGLLMPNRPEFMAVWLGITQVGGVVALLNTNLTGASLAHSIQVAAPKHLIVAAELFDSLAAALGELATPPVIWIHGAASDIEQQLEQYGGESLDESERRPVTIEDRALYIYTSGTTGLPKAAAVSHGRVMQWSHWFAGLLRHATHGPDV